MSKKHNKVGVDVDQLKKILRVNRLEMEDLYGRPRSKSWDSRPNVKKQRHQEKQKLRNIRNINDYNGDDE
jgi:hypothetical protein